MLTAFSCALCLSAWSIADVPGTMPMPTTCTAPMGKDASPLEIDGAHIAVMVDDLAGLIEHGPALGLDLSGVTASGVTGWYYIALAEPQADAGVRRVVREVASSPHVTFASPVFLGGTQRLPWVPTPEVIVQLGGPDTVLSPMLDVRTTALGGLEGMVLAGTSARTGMDVLGLVHRLNAQDDIAWAQPNAIWWARHTYEPNDPDYPSQWALNQSNDMDMDAPECWDTTFGDASILVAVMDDGIDQSHPDISTVPGADFTDENTGGNHTTQCDGHGSCVAGCVSATIDNNMGVSGIAPGCRSMATRIFNAIDFFGFCFGFIETTDAWIINGITWAQQNGARVTNSSWGGGQASSAVNSAFDSTRAQGVLHVAAAGNDGSTNVSWPASHSSVLAVAAIQSNGNLASFSTSGSGLFCSAPGAGIRTTDWQGSNGFDGGDWATVDGTSFASPYVAGVAALVFSMDDSLTPAEVEDILAETCTDRGSAGYDTTYGWGIVNAAGAVEAVDVEQPCPGDTDGDGMVGANDLLAAIADWGPCSGCVTDFDGDGMVGANDILLIISVWGGCP